MTLQNFEKARENMVLSQLQPSGIVSERVMDAYRVIPREMFVPNALRGVSYLDDDIQLGGGRVFDGTFATWPYGSGCGLKNGR
jgi:protein-L-isoaspartate(D-aspartate) O-methyltransferase